jgi:hypothetical protein
MIVAHTLTFLFCAGVCATCRNALRANLLKIGIFGSLGVIHGLVPIVTPEYLRDATPVQLLDTRSTVDARTPAAWYALAAVVLLALGWKVYEALQRSDERTNQALYKVLASDNGQQLYRFLFWASLALTLVGIVLQFKATGASLDEFVNAVRFEHYKTRNPILYLLGANLTTLAFIPGFVGFFMSRYYRTLGIAFALCVTLLLFSIVAKGTRNLPLGLLGGLGVAYIMRYPITPRRFLLSCVGAALIAFLAISLYEIRKVMQYASAGDMVAMSLSPETYQASLISDPLNYHEYLVAAMAYFPDSHPYLNGATYRRILFFWMSSGWEDSWKPEDSNVLFAIVLGRPLENEATVPPSIPGDVYLNFWGWWGIPVMFVHGMFFGWMSKKLRTSVLWFTIFGAIAGRFLLLVIRGQPYDLFVMVAFVLAGSYLLSWLGPYSFARAQRDVRRISAAATFHRAPIRAVRKQNLSSQTSGAT